MMKKEKSGFIILFSLCAGFVGIIAGTVTTLYGIFNQQSEITNIGTTTIALSTIAFGAGAYGIEYS